MNPTHILNERQTQAQGQSQSFRYYKLIFAYQGTDYRGLQRQVNAIDTIQAKVEESLLQYCQALGKTHKESKLVKLIWASRTDAGVHATFQVGRLQTPWPWSEKQLLRGPNNYLPKDIRIVQAEECAANFVPRLHAQWKEYLYLFSNLTYRHYPFNQQLVANYAPPLNFSLMKKTCDLLIGNHNFFHFHNGARPIEYTTRKIYECDLWEEQPHGTLTQLWYPFPVYVFKIKGQGFLKQMVRIIVGQMWAVGSGRITLEEFQKDLLHPEQGRKSSKHKVGRLAPPWGLYLNQVSYSPWD